MQSSAPSSELAALAAMPPAALSAQALPPLLRASTLVYVPAPEGQP